MNKKNTIKKAAAIFLSLGLALGGTGCAFVTTDTEADMQQTVAKVNIVKYLEDDADYGTYASELSEIITKGNLETEIVKSDLISMFLSVGYNYVQSYGYSYKDTFNLLMDSLVSRKIMAQYAMAYYLKEKGLSATDCLAFVAAEKTQAAGAGDAVTVDLLEAHPEVSTLKYFLTENGKDFEKYNETVYNLKKSVNSSLDSMEQEIIEAQDDNHTHDETRTTPTNVNVEKTEDYIPENYGIYTGRNTPDSCGEYERVDGSTTVTRGKAYSRFLANLQSNNLIKKDEDTSDFTKLDYYYVELAAQLEQALITKYTEDLDKKFTDSLSETYVKGKYEELLKWQQSSYDKDHSAFETALGSVSDTSFVTYSPKANYGFVYNILLPFSASQTQSLNAEKNRNLGNRELYEYRAQLLTQIKGKDLRGAWFCADNEDEHYAYSVGEGNSQEWYFFENQTGANRDLDKYEKLVQYAGNYAYNGTVTVDEKTGEYTCKPNPVTIDQFIPMMQSYLAAQTGVSVTGEYYADYVTDGADYKMNAKDEFTDYLQFMYYTGKVNFTEEQKAGEYFLDGTQSYNAVAAFNELMFAYSTDTGCLNTYMGYVVSPYKTSFVGEFEAAAQYAIRELGQGGYVVCPSEYGWHIIYVSYAFGLGEVYGDGTTAPAYNHQERESEGTFSYLFYESLKSKVSSDTSIVQDNILTEYNNDTCVKLYESRYQDLLDIEA